MLNTHNMTLSLPHNKVLAIKTQAAKVASSPACRGLMRLLGFDKLCQHGTTTGKITFLPCTILVQGELHDSSWPVKMAEARLRGNPSPALVVNLQATTKIYMQTLNKGSSHKRCPQGGYGGHMNNLSFRIPVKSLRKKWGGRPSSTRKTTQWQWPIHWRREELISRS